MGLFGNSKKGKVVLTTQKAGNGLKRVKFALGANAVLMLLQAFGIELPEEVRAEVANVIVSVVGLAFDYISYRRSKKDEPTGTIETPEIPE